MHNTILSETPNLHVSTCNQAAELVLDLLQVASKMAEDASQWLAAADPALESDLLALRLPMLSNELRRDKLHQSVTSLAEALSSLE